jgi:UDP-N-acetylmuramate--alanine ligase
LFSRTRDFADDFATSLDLLDECILLDIYPAREKPIEGVTSAWLLSKMKIMDKKVMTKQQVLDRVKESEPEVLLTMGAGDIDSLIVPLETILKK